METKGMKLKGNCVPLSQGKTQCEVVAISLYFVRMRVRGTLRDIYTICQESHYSRVLDNLQRASDVSS